ncbi:MAG: sigma-70 family RNA polymerase sigma factor [Candidatus Brocadiia bacterium]|nr:MAG: sigma-70 family RNA polymerase sigma factor [Candidatus Brocadiia bacterium]
MSKQEFRTLVNDYGAQVLSTAMRILGNSEKAQDVHQEVFLAIWKRWHKYNGRTNWNAYLYRAAVRKAIEFAKRSRAEQSRRKVSLMGLRQQPKYGTSTDHPDGPMRTAELQQMLARYLARLPRRQADVFVLSRIEGLGAGEIAEILGCSQQTVRVHLHRAIKRLALELSDYFTE